MKRLFSICAVLVFALNVHSQSTVAKFKYEDAEKAFYDNKFEDCIQLLTETEALLGQTAPNILHLRILAEHKLFEKDPYKSYEALEAMRNNCNTYLASYDIAGSEEKYRDVYEIQNKLPATTRQEYKQIEAKRAAKREKEGQLAGLLNLVFVEGGSFEMGDGSEENNPRHEVTLSDFYIGKYEVTIGEFEEFLKETQYTPSAKKTKSWVWKKNGWKLIPDIDWTYSTTGKKYKTQIEKRPVAYIIYDDAVAFCQWLSTKYGVSLRLPTEAEWEYAARGGQKSKGYKYSGGNDLLKISWNADNSNGNAHPVGEKLPNELELYDMTGNVLEWVNDWYDKEYYKNGRVLNPIGPATGTRRVVRGGGPLQVSVKYTTVFNRVNFMSAHPQSHIGFRYVLELE